MIEARTGDTITIANLSVKQGGVRVLHDLSLTFAPGSMTVLIGPNGCGKSTLLKSIARILPTEQGRIFLGDDPIGNLPAWAVARRMAMLPQSPVTPEGLRVRDLVAQGRHPYRSLIRQWSEDDDVAIACAMTQANVSNLKNARVETLSGGQRQRVWIAMALAQQTGILLLDEPTTYLDLAVQIDIMRLLSGLARAGRCVVVVLHELNLAAAFADCIVMMKQGQIVAQGNAIEVLTSAKLRDVFGVDAHVIPDPETGRPVCVPRSGLPE